MSAVNFILSLARKTLARESKGITTIPNRMAVEAEAGQIAAILQNAGLPLNKADEFIKSEADLVRILNQIKALEKRNFEEGIRGGITQTETGKVFDMKGREIKNTKNIMGGEEVKETEAQIKRRLEKNNKEGIARIKNKKMVEEAIDNVSPGFVKGDRKYNAQLVAEDLADKKFGKDFYDLDQKQQMDLYGEALDGLSVDLDKFAQGGRAGFSNGGIDILKAEDKAFQNAIDAFKYYQKMGGKKNFKDYLKEAGRFGDQFRADGGRAGFFMGSPNPRGLGLLKSLLNFFGKKSDVIKNPSDVLRVSNPKAFNKMLEDAKGKIMRKEGILATDAIKDYQTQMAKDRVDTIREMLERGKRFKAADDKIINYKNEVKERLMRELNMSEEAAEQAADNMATLAMDVTKMEKTPKITDEGLLQLENVLKNMETGGKKARDLNADGGRIGFKDGMTRRTFLKIFGGLVSLPIIGKIVKPLKLTKGVSKVPIIKTDNVAGKPEWFDALVNKVIIEGDDVTKKFSTGERQSIHQKTLDDGSVVRVTEDIDDGAIRVEYDSDANVFEDTVQMEYKKPLPDEGNPRPSAEFTTSESGPVGRSYGPDDYEIDVDEVGGTSIRDLDSDVSILKEYATGKKPTMKEIVEIKKRKDKAKAITTDPEAQSDAVIARQGEALDYDDYASGGIARMLGE